MARAQWVIEKHDPDEGDDCEWQCFSLGLVEEGFFRTIANFYDEADAMRFRAAIQWLEDLEEFTIRAAAPPVIKPRARRKTRSTK